MLGPRCDGRREAAPVGITACPCQTEGFASGILSSTGFSTGKTPSSRPLPASRRSRSVPVLLFSGHSRPRRLPAEVSLETRLSKALPPLTQLGGWGIFLHPAWPRAVGFSPQNGMGWSLSLSEGRLLRG